MAEVLKEFTFPGRGKWSPYPWDEWMDGRIWRVRRGVDFHSQSSSFRVTVQTQAFRHNRKVRTTVDGDCVVFQFEKKET